jgi:endonuclease YncB( thermonuclease family)
VADGDTLTVVSENGPTLRIRLLGIDAEEGF